METISVLKMMPETKAQQENFASRLLNSVMNGSINPVDLDILLKSIENTIAIVRKDNDFKECLNDELYKYHEKTIDFANCEITKAQSTTRDYKEDSVWCDLKDKLKAREELLKLSEKQSIVDGETGEEVNPVTVKHSEYIRYKFK